MGIPYEYENLCPLLRSWSRRLGSENCKFNLPQRQPQEAPPPQAESKPWRVTSTTEATMIAFPVRIWRSLRSCRTSHPRNTATTGLTQA